MYSACMTSTKQVDLYGEMLLSQKAWNNCNMMYNQNHSRNYQYYPVHCLFHYGRKFVFCILLREIICFLHFMRKWFGSYTYCREIICVFYISQRIYFFFCISLRDIICLRQFTKEDNLSSACQIHNLRAWSGIYI